MKRIRNAAFGLLLLAGLSAGPMARAEDTVTIPKSRLEELERQAAELEKLKRQLNRTEQEKEQLKQRQAQSEAEKQQLRKAKEAAETKAAAAAAALPPPARLSPAMASLPPLKEGDVVDALDLLNHFLADPPAAAARYEKQPIQVQGEIAGFSKPMFVRPYKILLKTADPTKRVVCTLFPPAQYKAVYTAKNGTQLVGLTTHESEVPLFRVGQKVIIEGSCRGANDDGVQLGTCMLKAVE